MESRTSNQLVHQASSVRFSSLRVRLRPLLPWSQKHPRLPPSLCYLPLQSLAGEVVLEYAMRTFKTSLETDIEERTLNKNLQTRYPPGLRPLSFHAFKYSEPIRIFVSSNSPFQQYITHHTCSHRRVRISRYP